MIKNIVLTGIIISAFFNFLAASEDERTLLEQTVRDLNNAVYEVERSVREDGIAHVVRYEKVYKSGQSKLVLVNTPYRKYAWHRNPKGEYVILGDIALEPMIPISDAEDAFIRTIKNEDYTVEFFIDLPASNKFIISSKDVKFEVTFDENNRLLRLVKRYPFHTIEVNYKNYSQLSEEGSLKLYNILDDKVIVDSPMKFSESFIRNNFHWSAMDFIPLSNNIEKSSIYVLYLFSSSMGRIIIYLFSGVSTEDIMDKIGSMCNEFNLKYYIEEFENGSKLAIMGNLNDDEYEEFLTGIIPDRYNIK
ncbi:MAG: hypothetical protein FXF54_11060 [Kosmotoga sp.]|nr:MAG: hypothetical protein FXF54_11060 [Kosmotoga sp.]